MSATIKIGRTGTKATVKDGLWTCDLESWANLLNGWREDDWPQGDVDNGLAAAAVQRLKAMNLPAEMLTQDEPEGDEGKVY